MKRFARRSAAALGLAATLLSCGGEPEVEHPALGTVVCRVLVDRAPDGLPRLVVDKNVERCGEELADPVLSVKDGGLKDAVVGIDWPYVVPNDGPREIQLKGAGCLFQPRVQLARTGDVLRLGSGDDITHNPHGWLDGTVTVFNFTILNSTYSFKRTLERAGVYRVDCDTHKWMRAYVHAFDHPYAALTDETGTARLELPAGAQTLHVGGCPVNAGDLYFVAGGATGTAPGFSAFGLAVPLNPDAYFFHTVNHPGAAPLAGSFGALDATGCADASFSLPPLSPPSLAGLVLHHAWALLDSATLHVEAISGAVPLALVP